MCVCVCVCVCVCSFLAVRQWGTKGGITVIPVENPNIRSSSTAASPPQKPGTWSPGRPPRLSRSSLSSEPSSSKFNVPISKARAGQNRRMGLQDASNSLKNSIFLTDQSALTVRSALRSGK